MKKFITKIFIFTLINILFFLIAVNIYYYKDDNIFVRENIPAPNMSNSISLNDKLMFASKKKAECISVGSSMTLNNLHSKTIINSLKSKSYLNLASWWMNIKDTYVLLKIYSEIYKPKTIIINSNIVDFIGKSKTFNEFDLKDYLINNNNFRYHLKYFNIKYYLKNFDFYKENKNSKKIYSSLVYDNYGGVLFDKIDFKISKKKWNNLYSNYKKDTLNYIYLDSLCSYTKNKNIKLIFIQSPFREGLSEKINLEKHINKIKYTVEKYVGIFIDGTKQKWNDTLFVDAVHFNKEGAEIFTKFCMSDYKKNIINKINK